MQMLNSRHQMLNCFYTCWLPGSNVLFHQTFEKFKPSTHRSRAAHSQFDLKENSISFHCERLVIKVPLSQCIRLLPHFKTLPLRYTKLWFIIIIVFAVLSSEMRLYGFLMSFFFLRNEIEWKLDQKQVSMAPTGKSFACSFYCFFVKLIFIVATCLSRRYQFL
jgi:hypothetical protein